MFVTLEPCHHQGQTPPCSHVLAKYSFATLTYGSRDPFTQQKGLNYLKRKDIKTFQSLYHRGELEELVSAFKFSISHKRAFVSLKIASSVDGNIALKEGDSQWITGKEARQHAQLLRVQHSAVLIGVNTLLKDNPRLNIRHKSFKNKKNKIVILDPKGKSFSFLLKSRLLKIHSAENVIICCGKGIKQNSKHTIKLQKEGLKIKLFKIKAKNTFNLNTVLKCVYQEENIQSVLVEGGAFTISEFLKQHSAQRIFLYMAPCILGDGLKWAGAFTVHNLAQRVSMKNLKWKTLNEDLLLKGDLLF